MKILFKNEWCTKDKIQYFVVYKHPIKDKRFGDSHSKFISYEFIHMETILKFITITYLATKN